MPLTKQEKEKIVGELSEKLSRTKSAVLADFTGLNVVKERDLRNKLRKENIDYKVAKKTLINIALRNAKLQEVNVSQISGPIAIAIGYEDEVAPAKIINKFAKTNEALKILGGILENKLISKEEVVRLAFLPSKPELVARTVSTIAAPLSNFIGVLEGNMRKLVYVLSAISDSSGSALGEKK